MSRQFEVKQGQPWGWTHPKKNPCPFCGEFLLSRAVGDDPLSFRLYCDNAECEVREFRIEASQVEVSVRTEELDALKTSGHGRDWNGESGVYIDPNCTRNSRLPNGHRLIRVAQSKAQTRGQRITSSVVACAEAAGTQPDGLALEDRIREAITASVACSALRSSFTADDLAKGKQVDPASDILRKLQPFTRDLQIDSVVHHLTRLGSAVR
jgi:hypothetical protein